MGNVEDECRDLREKNSELVLAVEFFKKAASDKDKEKIELMKEINELRLKISRLQSSGATLARKLDMNLQSTSEEALNHLVQASCALTRSMGIIKDYVRERDELDTISPRWSTMSSGSERVNIVPPLLLGGQSIQPVVALNRVIANRSLSTASNQSNNSTSRAPLPIHMLRDFYIPLSRMDVADLLTTNRETDDNSADDITLEDGNDEQADDPSNLQANSRRLDIVAEDVEEEAMETSRARLENPLEGPSWLLDMNESQRLSMRVRVNLEPDSTTHGDEAEDSGAHLTAHCSQSPGGSRAFTPTVRRRAPATRPPDCTDNRILKVMVSKMRLSNDESLLGSDLEASRRSLVASSPILPAIANPGRHQDPVRSAHKRPVSPEDWPQSPVHVTPPKRQMDSNTNQEVSDAPAVNIEPAQEPVNGDISMSRNVTKRARSRVRGTNNSSRNNSGESRNNSGESRNNSGESRNNSRERRNKKTNINKESTDIDPEVSNSSRENHNNILESRNKSRESRKNSRERRKNSRERRNNSRENSSKKTDGKQANLNIDPEISNSRREGRNEGPETSNNNQESRNIVGETSNLNRESRSNSRLSHSSRMTGNSVESRYSRGSRNEGESDNSSAEATDARSRRRRNKVSYKEKPLNRKLRR